MVEVCGVYGTTGKNNDCITLDGGTDYLTNTSISKTFSAITISFWFNANTGSSENYAGFIALDGTELYMRRNVGTNDIMIELGGRTMFLQPNDNSFDGNWHHVVGTWSDSDDTVELWVDGSSQGTDTGTSGTLSITSSLEIGRDQGNNARSYAGEIDELYIWDVRLDDTDIGTLYNSGNGTFYPFTSDATVTPAVAALTLGEYEESVTIEVEPAAAQMTATTVAPRIKTYTPSFRLVSTGEVETATIRTTNEVITPLVRDYLKKPRVRINRREP